MRKNKLFWGAIAPVAAILTSLFLMYIILSLRGADPFELFKLMVSYGFDPRNLVSETNLTVSYYLAGVAAAIGFKMLLFNIGIDGQYRMGAFFGAGGVRCGAHGWPQPVRAKVGSGCSA